MGIFRTAGKAAVAGAAVGRVQRRQQQRWAAQDQAAAQQAPATQPAAQPETTPQPAAAASAGAVPTVPDTDTMLAQLKQLGELRDAGVLTEEEFQVQKARILGG